MKKTKLLLSSVTLLAASSIMASLSIPTVEVADPANPADTTGYGSVNYTYHIGTTEVTNSQYATFLNAVAATDTNALYNNSMGTSSHGGILRSGTSGSYTYSVKAGMGDKPVSYVSFWDAARFANWLTNGQTSGGTETGVYDLTDPFTYSSNLVTRDATAWANGGVAIASLDEWYKAAYYDPTKFPGSKDGDTDYWLYATQSDTISIGEANYAGSVGTFTNVGNYASQSSYYGTYDQNGNAWEWTETIASAGNRGMRGGSFSSGESTLLATHSTSTLVTNEASIIGFRITSLEAVPEPATFAAIMGALALLGVMMARRRR